VRALSGLPAALAAAALAADSAGGQAPPPAPPPNPCQGPDKAQLLCPDLIMAAPANIYVQRAGGRTFLHATNAILNIGRGPAELRGHRTGRFTMGAVQVIHRTNGSRVIVRTGAHLGWKAIPGQGHYWKFRYAARFALWSVDSDGNPVKRVRTGEKQYYCLRDLEHRKPGMRRSPSRAVYPSCNQNAGQQKVTLGTSVGWADVYPRPTPSSTST